MATIKSHTDLSQSKKLAKILPIESADMWYHGHGSPWESERVYDSDACPFHSMSPNWDKPCWSLASLLGVLPNYQLQTQDDGIGILCSCDGKFNIVTADTPVDACVAMIEKLKELKML